MHEPAVKSQRQFELIEALGVLAKRYDKCEGQVEPPN